MTKDIIGAIHAAMADDEDWNNARFIDWFGDLTDDEKKVADFTLIYVCGWGFDSLTSRAEEIED